MAIKLIKACKKLNISMSTAVEFCAQLGREIPSDPNVRLDDDLYMLLAKRFNQEQYLELVVSEEKNAIEESTEVETTTGECVDDEPRLYRLERVCREFRFKLRDLVAELERRGVRVPMDANYRLTRTEYDLVREFYLNSPKGQSLLKTEVEDVDKETLKEIWNAHTEVQEQILKLRSTPVKVDPSSVDVIGDKLHIQAVYETHVDEIINRISEALHVNISEQDLRNGYFLVSPDSLDELHDNQKKQILEMSAANQVGMSFRPMVDGFIKSRTTNMAKFYELLSQLQIKPELDRKGRMLMTTDDLQNLKLALKESKNVDVPTQASAILNIAPSLSFVLAKEFPFIKFEQELHSEKISYRDESGEWAGKKIFYQTLVVNGGYFKEEIAQRLFDSYGMTLHHVDFIFQLTHDSAMTYDWKNNPLGLKKNDTYTTTFTRKIVYSKDPLNDEPNDEINVVDDLLTLDSGDYGLRYERIQRNMFKFGMELSLWKKTMNRVFGEDGYTLTVKYSYRYNPVKSWVTDDIKSDFDEMLRSYIAPAHLSISNNQKNVGIDFDWTEDELINIAKRLNADFPFVQFNLYEDHKCKVDIKVNDLYLKETKELMTERYEGLEFVADEDNHAIYFYKECDSIEQELQMRQFLVQEARGLSNDKVDVTIYPVLSNMVKLRLVDDDKSRKEECSQSIRELRGAEFTVGDKPLGKLINANDYPHLIFDISGDYCEKTKELLSDFHEEYIHPNLMGDQEKVARLKESLKKITSGKGVQNPNLSYFIFDASTLRPEPDFDDLVKLELQEIDKHLLNTRVNASQKKAIAKSLLAKDLSLIQGPPGTGKSTAIAEIIWQHIRKEPDSRILLTSETNLAVDNAIAKVLNSHHNLVKPIRIGSNERLESEGRQFSLSVLQKWAGITVLNHIAGTENDDFEIGDESFDGGEDFVITEDEEDFEAEEINEEGTIVDVTRSDKDLNALEKWLLNIANRADSSRMAPETLAKWKKELKTPEQSVKKAVYDAYIKHCNVIGATCSSIGKENIMLSRLLSDKYGKDSHAFCSFYKTYQQIYGEQRFNVMSGKQTWSQPPIEFSVVIQDESSKATPAELSLPLIYGLKNIVIGDHRQLPPMLSKESFEQSFDFLLARATDEEEKLHLKDLKLYVQRNFSKLEKSHFERLFRNIPKEFKGVFNTQYRMHPAINEVIKQFYRYDGGLGCGLTEIDENAADNPQMHDPCSRYHGINIPGLLSEQDHVIWIDTDTPEMLDGTSRVNHGEVDVIRKVLHYMAKSESYKKYLSEWTEKEDKQIGLISFYGKQLRLLKEVGAEVPEIPIRISTVDRFQGMERNIVIVSMVRSNCIAYSKEETPNWDKYPDYGFMPQDSLGFADSPNRLNVALSRAKRLLIIVGNSDHFRKHPIYNNVYQTITAPYGRIIKASEL